MAIKTRRSLGAVANSLRMKTVIVSGVRCGVKQRPGQVGKLLAWAVTALALQVRWLAWKIFVRAADDGAGIWLERIGG